MENYACHTEIVETSDNGGAYLRLPWDIRKEFGKGRLKVEATFDGVPYHGSIVNMGVKHADGNICYIIGIPKKIRKAIGKSHEDMVHVRIVIAE